MTVTRTFELTDLSPQELAELFAGMWSNQQAQFFNEIGRLSQEWPGTGWCAQACEIVRCQELDDAGRRALRQLADHVNLYEQAT